MSVQKCSSKNKNLNQYVSTQRFLRAFNAKISDKSVSTQGFS
jgi:hypothetical protein